jgi:hypothetical protein
MIGQHDLGIFFCVYFKMSTRPVRTRKPPNRLTTGVVETRARKKVKKSGASKIIKKKKMVEKTIIKDKKTLISYIDTKIGNTGGKNKLAWMTLRHIYDDYTDTGIKSKFKNLSNSDIDRSLQIQHDIIIKPGTTLSDNIPSTLNIKMNDEKMINLLVMVWLDMTHDETVPLNTSFQDFLKSDYVKFLIKNTIKFTKNTGTIDKMINYQILKIENGKLYRFNTSQKSVSDSALKNNIHNIWNDGKGMHFFSSTTKIKSKIKQPTRPIYMSLDSEDSNLVELIKSSKIGNSYYIKPLINVGNLLDPGRGGGSTGQRGGTMDRLTRQLFKTHPYTHYKFDVNTYTFNFGKYMTISIYINDTEFNISVNNVPLKMGTTSKKAKDGGIIEKISKFMGDFAQILTVSHQYKNGLRVVSGTIDGVFVGITAFLQKELLGLNPRVIIDNSTYGKNGLIIHGFDELLIKNNNTKQSPSVVNYIKKLDANARINENTRATTQMVIAKNGPSSSVKPPSRNNTAGMKRLRSGSYSSQISDKRTKVSPSNTSYGIKGKRTPPVRKAAPSRNNTAGMKRPRSTTSSVGYPSGRPAKQIKVSASNQSSAFKKKMSPNSVTQKRTPESVTRTASAKSESVVRTASAKPESVMRTASARPNTSNSARSNQTRG